MEPGASGRGRRCRRGLAALALAGLAGGCGFAHTADIGPGLNLSRDRAHPIPLHVHQIARRVEHLRGLRFHRIPRVRIDGPAQLFSLGRSLRRAESSALRGHPLRARRDRRLFLAQTGLGELAGLLPAGQATEASGSRSSAEQVGGAYDYLNGQIVLVNRVIQTRRELKLVLAHELTHALEDQNFDLRLAGSRGPAQPAQARRALIEGTATFVAARYDARYLGSREPVGQQISGQQSVFAAGGGTPFAVKADTIFDYVSGPLFVQGLYRRDDERWALVNRALRGPPRRTQQILHPPNWPHPPPARPVKPEVGGLLGAAWHRVGGGAAGEQDALTILSEGAPGLIAEGAATGWRGGGFSVWRRPGTCRSPCGTPQLGVVAFDLHAASDVPQFADAFYDYALIGRLGQRIGPHTWRLESGYAALGLSRRRAAIAFGPTQRLTHAVAKRAAEPAGSLRARASRRAR